MLSFSSFKYINLHVCVSALTRNFSTLVMESLYRIENKTVWHIFILLALHTEEVLTGQMVIMKTQGINSLKDLNSSTP